MKDYYYILGIKPNATTSEIKSAYRKLAKIYHPDKNPGDPLADERIKEINEAHETLIDPVKKQRYDRNRKTNTTDDSKEESKTKEEKPVPPIIRSFSVDKTKIKSSEEFTLSWITSHSETVTISPFNVQVVLTGSRKFRIPKIESKTEKIKVKIIAKNRVGSVECELELTNHDYNLLPEILQFSVNKNTLNENDEITVNWIVNNSETTIIQPLNISLSSKGNQSFQFHQFDKNIKNISLKLIAYNQFGTVEKTLEIINSYQEQPPVPKVEPKAKNKNNWYLIGLFLVIAGFATAYYLTNETKKTNVNTQIIETVAQEITPVQDVVPLKSDANQSTNISPKENKSTKENADDLSRFKSQSIEGQFNMLADARYNHKTRTDFKEMILASFENSTSEVNIESNNKEFLLDSKPVEEYLDKIRFSQKYKIKIVRKEYNDNGKIKSITLQEIF